MEPAASLIQLRPGEILRGKYEVLGDLGEGGYGKVYSAVNINLGTRVAIKVRRAAVGDERIWREGKAAAQLRSPHTVRVFDVDRLDDGSAYLVMELLEGQSLKGYLQQNGRVAPDLAVRWSLELCAALREAHSIDLIHRDIKPSNIFIVEGPSLEAHMKLLDFGLAKVLQSEGDGTLTESGVVIGSPAYMSPEQIRAAALTAQTDIWSLGVVIYEMLAGTRPFAADGTTATLVAIAADPPIPLAKVAPHVPTQLCAIVERCLRKSEEERYRSIDELLSDLKAFELDRISSFPPPIGPPRPTSDDTLSVTVPALVESMAPPPQVTRSKSWVLGLGVIAGTALVVTATVGLRQARSAAQSAPTGKTSGAQPAAQKSALPVAQRAPTPTPALSLAPVAPRTGSPENAPPTGVSAPSPSPSPPAAAAEPKATPKRGEADSHAPKPPAPHQRGPFLEPDF